MSDVIFKRGTKEIIDDEPISDGKILFTTDQTCNAIYTDVNSERIKIGGQQDVDTSLSATSINPVQNKVVTENINRVDSDISQINNSLTDKIYPVGSIYMSVNSTSPSTLFGGTWQQIKDKFLLSAGDTYTVGTTGGEASHRLTTNEMPTHAHGSGTLTTETAGAHNHNITGGASFASGSGNAYWWAPIVNGSGTLTNNISTSGQHTHTISGSTANNGSGTAHNNMPPYVTVYVWQRIA